MSALIKFKVADTLREEIMRGRLRPGERVVEGQWAAQLKVAQASIREAVNILATEGIIKKVPGRCAQVIDVSVEENFQMFQVRIPLEALAARLVAEKRPDLSALDQVIADMRAAAECSNLKAFYERDIRFHVLFSEMSGNAFLADAIKRLVIPSVTVNLMRVNPITRGPGLWKKSVKEHAQILDAVRRLDPPTAQRFVEKTIQKFCDDNRRHLVRQVSNGARSI